MKNREFVKRLKEELSELGIESRLEQGGKHPRLVFVHDGRQMTYVFPASPSDHRGLQNAVAELRRMVGAPRSDKPAKPARSHKRRVPVARPPVVRFQFSSMSFATTDEPVPPRSVRSEEGDRGLSRDEVDAWLAEFGE